MTHISPWIFLAVATLGGCCNVPPHTSPSDAQESSAPESVGSDEMTPANRKLALEFIRDLAESFKATENVDPKPLHEALAGRLSRLDALKSGNAADRRAYAASERLVAVLRYISTPDAKDDPTLDRLLRLPSGLKNAQPAEIAAGVGALLADNLRAVAGQAYAKVPLGTAEEFDRALKSALANSADHLEADSQPTPTR